MAKSRAQKKAERRKRAAQGKPQPVPADSTAQAETQVPESAQVAEAEATLNLAAAKAAEPAPFDPAAPVESRRERRRREREEAAAKEERRKAREARPVAVEERSRGRVTGFIASCWAELKRVQWPDRATLIQASAVTVGFVVIAAIYLGALDAVFNFVVKRIL